METKTAPDRLTSPLARAIESTISLFAPTKSADSSRGRVAFFSYRHAFETLWLLRSNDCVDLATGSDTLVVLCDLEGENLDLPEARNYLTAHDWAVWFGLDRLDRNADLPHVVLVEGIRPAANSRQADAERFFSIFPGNIPSVPWVTTLQFQTAATHSCFLMQAMQAIWLHDPTKNQPPNASLVRQIWQSFFLRPSQPSDNHALANLLGVSLLTGDLHGSPTRGALMKLMRTLLLLPAPADLQDTSDNVVTNTSNRIYSRLRSGAGRPLHLLLVDDDHRRHSWSGFVAKSFCLDELEGEADSWTGKIGKFGARLSATDSAWECLKSLTCAIEENANLRWRSEHPLDVLFLDLRLFERADLLEEVEFFEQVIELVRQVDERSPGMPGDWPRINSHEVDRIETWCKLATAGIETASRDDATYIDAATLLPRLIAIVEPDLPIVLFSSTQRRRVTENLKPYASILTGFSKPALQLGQGAEQIKETISKLNAVSAQAFELVHARRLRQSLLASECDTFWRGHVEQPVDLEAEKTWHVQLLLDETGEEPLTVGGFLAIYPPGVSPAEVNDAIYAANPQIRDGKANNRKRNLSALLWETLAILESHQVLAVPISLTGRRTTTTTALSNWIGSDVFRDEMVGDNLHRELMRCLIELGLFVFARQILPESAAVEFSFHAPTRVLPVTQSDADALDSTWGVRCWQGRRGDLIASHFESSSARALLEEVFREYRASNFEPSAVRARGFGLSDDAPQAEKQKVYALHYLADGWLNDHTDAQLREFNLLAIEGDYGPKLSRLLRAHRSLVQADLPRAVAVGAEVAMGLKPTQRSTAMHSILIALQDAASSMTGPEARILASSLKQRTAERKSELLLGRVQEFDAITQRIVIESDGRLFTTTGKHCKTPVDVGDTVRFQPRRGNRVGSFIAHGVRSLDSD